MIKLTVANQRMLQIAYQKNIEFERERQALLNNENEIKKKMEHDGFEELYEHLIKENK